MRTRSIAFRAVLVTAVLALFATGVASAESFTDTTKLTIHVKPDTRVPAGTEVTIKGKLKADHKFCRKNSKVTLRAYGETQADEFPGGVIDKTRTDEEGKYKFKFTVTEQIRVRVWFKGKVGGVHPDIKTCEKSRSKTVTLKAT